MIPLWNFTPSHRLYTDYTSRRLRLQPYELVDENQVASFGPWWEKFEAFFWKIRPNMLWEAITNNNDFLNDFIVRERSTFGLARIYVSPRECENITYYFYHWNWSIPKEQAAPSPSLSLCQTNTRAKSPNASKQTKMNKYNTLYTACLFSKKLKRHLTTHSPPRSDANFIGQLKWRHGYACVVYVQMHGRMCVSITTTTTPHKHSCFRLN